MAKGLRELNSKNMYTAEQLRTWKKFQGMYLDVYPRHHEYWVDGKGYETVYEVRDISDEIKENYLTVSEILRYY